MAPATGPVKHPRLVCSIMSAALIAAAAVAGFAWWRSEQNRQLMVAGLPMRPPLTGANHELPERVAACEQHLRAGRHALASLVELSRLYHANGFFPEAERCYQLLMQTDPGNARWPYLLATIVAGYGQLDEAWPLWQRVVALAPDYGPAKIRLGDAFLKLNDFERAAAAYTQAIGGAKGDEAYAQVGLARVDLHFERWAAARPRLEAAVAQTDYRIGGDLLTTVYEQTGDPARALEIRGRAKSSGSFSDINDPWAEEIFTDCYDVYRLQVAGGMAEHRGDPAAARELIEHALTLAPDDTGTLYQLGMLQLRQEALTEARRCFQRCVELRPDFPDGWAQLIGLLEHTGDRIGAERTLLTALAQCPRSPGLHLDHGRMLVQAGRTAEAMEEFRTSIRLRPEEAAAYLALATACFSLERVDEGMQELRKALKAEPDNPMALSTLAIAAIRTDHEAEARALLHRIKQQPRVAAKDLAALLAEYQTQFNRLFD